VLDDVELGGLHARLRGLEAGLRLLVPGDTAAAVEERPGEGQAEGPALVELRLATTIAADPADVGEESAEGLALGRLGRAHLKEGLAVLGPILEGLRALGLTVDAHGLEDQVVRDLGRRVHVDRHRRVEGDERGTQRILRPDEVELGVRHVDLGARHVGLRPRAHLEEALGGSEVQVGALERLLGHLDEALGKSVLVYASFTASAMSWRWSSMFSTATSASFRAASVAARVLPKSKRSCESWTCAKKVSASWLLATPLLVLPVVVEVTTKTLWLRVAVAAPVSCGRSGANAWFTR